MSIDDSQPDRTEEIARQGNAGFDRLYERIAPAMLVWLSLRIPAQARSLLAPEDVAQEVWFRASRAIDGFDPERGTFRSWIFGVAKNVLLQALRGLRRPDVLRRLEEPESGLRNPERIPDDVTSLTQRVARDEGTRRLVDWLRGLDRGDRDLVVHCGIEQMSHEAAARLLGIGTAALHQRWQRLCSRLREEGIEESLRESLLG